MLITYLIKKNFHGVFCALAQVSASSSPKFQSVFSLICFIKAIFIIFLIIEPSYGSNLYSLV